MKKRSLIVAFALLMIIALIPTMAFALDKPAGTETDSWANPDNWDFDWYDPDGYMFTISNEEQFAAFAAIVNGDAVSEGYDQNDFDGQVVNLAADLDLSGKVWKPIGGEGSSSAIYPEPDCNPDPDNDPGTYGGSGQFSGSFDGGSHSITYAMDENTNYFDDCSLFGLVSGGELGNFVVNVTADFPSIFKSNTFGLGDGEYREVVSYVAGVVLYADGGANIYGVTANGTINVCNRSGMAAGIAYAAYDAYFENCVNNVHIHIGQTYSESTEYQYALAGGIVCQTSVEDGEVIFDNCINHGNIKIDNPFDNSALTEEGKCGGASGTKYSLKLNAAGIVGQISGRGYTVVCRNCYSDGEITGSRIEKFENGVYAGTVQDGSFVGKMWDYNGGTPALIDYKVSTTDAKNNAFYANDKLFLPESIAVDEYDSEDYVDGYFYRKNGTGCVVFHSGGEDIPVTEAQLAKLNESCALVGTVVYGSTIVNQLPGGKTHTITLDPEGGTLPGSNTVEYSADSVYPELPTPTKAAALFDGWYGETDWFWSEFNVVSGQEVNVCEDITLYAKWLDVVAVINDVKYTSYDEARAAASGGFTGGYFNVDPRGDLADGYAVEASDNDEYLYMVVSSQLDIDVETDIVAGENEVLVDIDESGKTQAQIQEANAVADAAIEAINETTGVGGAESLLPDAASALNDPDVINEELMNAAEQALEADTDIEFDSTQDSITIVIEPYLDIKVVDGTKDGNEITSITYDIDAKYNILVTIAGSADDMILEGSDKNTIVLATGQDLTVTRNVQIKIPLPEAFYGEAEEDADVDVFVQHRSHEYKAEILKLGTYFAVFNNPDGFSEFLLTKSSEAVASIGDRNFTSIEAAIDEAGDDDVITITGDCSDETVELGENDSLRFKVNDGGTLPKVVAPEGFKVVQGDPDADGVVTFTVARNEEVQKTGILDKIISFSLIKLVLTSQAKIWGGTGLFSWLNPLFSLFTKFGHWGLFGW